MKNFVAILFFLPCFAAAQTTHKVEPKESLYSLARKYNIHPRELAAYNNISVETPLALGQVIRIPAKTTMAPLSTPAPTVTEKKEIPAKPVAEPKQTQPAQQETAFPIYHKVQKKETLYGISKLYPGITISDIKKWNKLTTDGLSEGTDIIVGYSKNKNATTATPVTPEKEPVADSRAVVTKPTGPEKREPGKIVQAEPVRNEEIKSVTGKTFNGGAFRSLYDQQAGGKKTISQESGPGGIFKSTSGWEDGKYYCLTNTAPAGSIVKVTNNANQRSVYAKVLDVIPDLKQNEGMIIRISNAAGEELGATSGNFDCTLNF